MTLARNHIWNLLCVLIAVVAALPVDMALYLPPRFKPYVVAIIVVAMWIKSHRNYFVNPDGTPASIAYFKEPKQ